MYYTNKFLDFLQVKTRKLCRKNISIANLRFYNFFLHLKHFSMTITPNNTLIKMARKMAASHIRSTTKCKLMTIHNVFI